MRFVALAVGFDGTLARAGRYDERCVDALRALTLTGRKLILVTARALRELLEVFPFARIFDYLIAENGAILHESATRRSQILAQAPPEILVQELERRGVKPIMSGSAIITTSITNESRVRDVLNRLRLEYQIVTNDASLIIAPVEVNKALGVREVLRQLGLSAHNLVVIGDAENDFALFHLAEHAVAVQNAAPVIKTYADRTTVGAYCDGFLEFAHDLTEGDLLYAQSRERIAIGAFEDGRVLSLDPYNDSLLIYGPSGSGKAMLCDQLITRLGASGYQCCLVRTCSGGPEPAEGFTALGDAQEAPRLNEVMMVLEHPSRSVLLDLTALQPEARSIFLDTLLVQLQALHDRRGRPHVLALHSFDDLTRSSVMRDAGRLSEMTRIYVSTELDRLPSGVLTSVRSIVALGTGTPSPPPAITMHPMRLATSESSQVRLAYAWTRRDPETARYRAQATADGAVCDMVRAPAADSGSVPAGGVSSVSG